MSALIIYISWVSGLMLSTLRWPAVAVGGVLCANGLFQWAQASIAMLAAHPMISNYLVGISLVLALLVMIFQQKPIMQGYPAAGWLSLMLLTYCLLSTLWSVAPELTWVAFTERGLYMFVTVIMCPLLISNSNDAKVAMTALVTFGAVLVLSLLLTGGFSGRSLQAIDPMYGSALNPLGLASMGMYVAVAATLMNFRGVSRLLQLLRWGVVAASLMLVMYTQSRGQFLAGFLMLVAFLPFSRQIRNKWGFLGAMFGLIFLMGISYWLVSTFGQARRWELDAMVGNFYETRIEPAHTVLSYWLNSNPIHWFLGLGSSACFSPRVLGMYPHVVSAEVLAELGLIGFGIFASLIFVSLRSTFRLAKLIRHDPVQRGVLAAISALFWLNFVLSFKQGSLLQSLDLFLFAIVLGRYDTAIRSEYAHRPQPQAELHQPARVIEIQPIRS
ncbi:hypothetical protein HED60_09280 [Planctomycetales bacterium ZRK34]|nr:hypothetical protein HED60_09280 [Planctomycetales bacterium ZRK34]